MTRIHTITYDRAKNLFETGRKYAPLGTKFDRNIWIKYDSENDRFVLHYIYSKYYQTVDANGNQKTARATTSERDKYTVKEIGHIYKDHVHLFPPKGLSTNNPAHNFFKSRFNCTYRRYPGVKVKGFEWTFFREGLSYWERTHGAGEVVLSGAGLRIYPDGRREATEPVMVRVNKKEQQNAMNRHIKAVRRMIGLRAKLGGFNSVDWMAKSAEFEEAYGGTGRQVLDKPSQVNDMFMAINDEDFTTMLPVLWLAACRNTAHYWREPEWGDIGASYDWTSAFNRLVDSVREGLRNEQGAVEYKLESEVAEETAVA